MREESIVTPRACNRPAEGNAGDLIQRRIDSITAWLAENAPQASAEQKHLDEGTAERAYWNYGYLVALRDMQKLLGLSQPLN